MKTKSGTCSAHAKQVGCRVRQQWELGVRLRLFGLHWSSCQKIKTVQRALFYCDLLKQNISTWCFPFVNTATSPDRTEQRLKTFQAGCFDFVQLKASVELCINKLSDVAAKSEVKANCEKFDSELGELGTLAGLADSCVSSDMTFWKGCRNTSKLIIPTHKNGDRSEWTNYISLLSRPGRVYAKMPRK